MAGVVVTVTLPMWRRAALLRPLAGRLGGDFFRAARPDRVLAWVDCHWSGGEVPTSLIFDAAGSAYYVGVDAVVGAGQVLIVGLRRTFWPRVTLVVLFAASAPDFALNLETEAWLSERGYVVNRSARGVLLTRDRAPAPCGESRFGRGRDRDIAKRR